jgi:hypothetical protein
MLPVFTATANETTTMIIEVTCERVKAKEKIFRSAVEVRENSTRKILLGMRGTLMLIGVSLAEVNPVYFVCRNQNISNKNARKYHKGSAALPRKESKKKR